jgi:hypothetical protein
MKLERLFLMMEDDEFGRGIRTFKEAYVLQISFDFMKKPRRTQNSSHFVMIKDWGIFRVFDDTGKTLPDDGG